MRISLTLHLGLMALTLAVIGSCVSAQPADSTDDSSLCSNGSCTLNEPERQNGGTDGTIDVGVQNWRGSAAKGDESHSLRLNLESIRSADPAEARDLLASNTSIEEIKSRMRSEDRSVIMRGNIRLDNNIFQLINITLTSSGNDSVLDADVVGPVAGPGSKSVSVNSANLAGHVTIAISIVESTGVGVGTLVMNGPDYSGTYELSLNYPSPGRGPRAGMAGAGQGR